MTSKKVTLFYDIISPYSWAGFEYATRYSQHSWKHTSLELKPMFLGGIMQGSKNKPPGLVPAKMKFMGHDMKYKKQFDGVPLNPIKDAATKLFKKGAMDAQRVLTAMNLDNNDKLEEVSRQFSVKMWHTDEDVTDSGVLREAAVIAGLTEAEFDTYWSSIKTAEVKGELGKVTKEALELGCFGAPWFLVDDGEKKHSIFGSDRMELICNLCDEEYKGTLKEHSKLKHLY